jgi:hypothetical protein
MVISTTDKSVPNSGLEIESEYQNVLPSVQIKFNNQKETKIQMPSEFRTHLKTAILYFVLCPVLYNLNTTYQILKKGGLLMQKCSDQIVIFNLL